jgi:RNA polymerase sigma-B factor
VQLVELELPSVPSFNAVGRLVAGGFASRLEFHVEEIEDLQLAVEALLCRCAAERSLTMTLSESECGLQAMLGPFARDPDEHARVARARYPGSGRGGAGFGRRRVGRLERSKRPGDSPRELMSIVMDRNVDALLIAYHRTGDQEAREHVLVELMPLVRALASRYAGRGEPLEDLVQVGALGLIKAVDRFDVDRGVEFSSYAVPTIVGEMRRHFRDKAWAMHVPRRLKELSVRLSRVLDELTTELGRSPTVSELAETTGVEEEDVIDALDAAHAYSTRSLEAPFDDVGEDNLSDKLGVEDHGYREVEEGSLVTAGLDALDERERRIVELRFFDEMTQSQIAAELGISQMHVSRLLRRALGTMRGRIKELMGDANE